MHLTVARLFAWLCLSAFVVSTAWLGSISENVRLYQVGYVVAFAGYVILCVDVLRGSGSSRVPAWWWLLGCVALRVLLLSVAPSDDVWRYCWEGRVQPAGFNPYAIPPDDAALEFLRAEGFDRINHPGYTAIYGPVAQVFFRLVTWVSPGVLAMKASLVACDVAVVGLLLLVLRGRGRPCSWAVLYGLCPLVVSAFAVEGHVDSLMLLFVVAGVLCWDRRWLMGMGVALGLAMGVKLVAVVLLPWLVLRRECWRAAVVAVVVCGLAYVPYAGAGFGLVESAFRFGSGGAFFSAVSAVGLDSGAWVGALLAVLLAGVLVYAARRRKAWDGYGLAASGALLVLLPIVHYWYAAFVLLFMPLTVRGTGEGGTKRVDWRTVPVRWIVVVLAMVLYFEAQRMQVVEGVWRMPGWCAVVVWSAWLAGALFDGVRRWSPDVRRRSGL